jgi:hypothetical protein
MFIPASALRLKSLIIFLSAANKYNLFLYNFYQTENREGILHYLLPPVVVDFRYKYRLTFVQEHSTSNFIGQNVFAITLLLVSFIVFVNSPIGLSENAGLIPSGVVGSAQFQVTFLRVLK